MSDPLPPAMAAELRGLQVIEASAGTGKTWTISGLYLRLLLERDAPVEQVLVMSFTRAATAELRERIRARVQGTLDALEGRAQDDELCRRIAAQVGDVAAAKRRLELALRSFDDAAIDTLHAFCQRVLRDHAFSSATLTRCELAPDDSAVVHEVLADFWRTRFHEPGSPCVQRLRAAWMHRAKLGLTALEAWVRTVRPTRFGRIDRDGVDLGDLPGAAEAFASAWDVASTHWQREGDRIAGLLRDHPAWSRGAYQARWLRGWCGELGVAFAGAEGELHALPKNLYRFTPAELAAGSKTTAPRHAFFDAAQVLIDAGARLEGLLESEWRSCRLLALERARAEVTRRLEKSHAQSYDDLLVKVEAALSGADADPLVEALRARYPYALIDEFQDTDPLQWSIFRRLYAGTTDAAAFLVGDPKQAIYRFRGADVYAYLGATGDCPPPIRLAENQRSAAPLVAAVNRLFEARPDSFREARIVFEPVAAVARNASLIEEAGVPDAAPLRFFFHPGKAQGKPLAKAPGVVWAAEQVARETSRLLHEDVRLDGARLRASQIAVLVNNHRQASVVRKALAGLGIGATELSNDSVLVSGTAEQVEQFLVAVYKPRDAGCVRTALANDLLCFSAADITALEEDESRWDRLVAQFDDLNATWQRHGVMRMLRTALQVFDISRKLAGFDDGERRLTDFLHLCEILHAQEQGGAGMERLLASLAALREGVASEEVQLRLESDENLVQILTIHRSKGLEFPVTFVPFLWDTRSDLDKQDMCIHHDLAAPYAAILDAGSPAFDTALARAREEELSERLRVAYVALTRAKKRCYVFCGALGSAQHSSLAWLVHGIDGARPRVQLPSGAQLERELRALCDGAGSGMCTVADLLQAGDSAERGEPGVALVAAQARRRVAEGFVQTSFTALVHSVERPLAADVLLADHDQLGRAQSTEEPAAPGGDRFSFPKGARAGICLHGIFETLAFDAPAQWPGAVQARLRGAGFDPAWAPATHRWLSEVMHTPLPDGVGGSFMLAQVAPRRLKRELAFHLATPDVVPAALARIAQGHGVPVSPLAPAHLHGYLSGYVDLVLEHAGRWYVLDYKSNWLGGAPDAYAGGHLARAMEEGDYHLQYLLYAVALRRLLRLRRPGFDAARDFGGVIYLFLRGMHPQWLDAGGASMGVYFSRPSPELLDALDAGLDGAVVRAGQT